MSWTEAQYAKFLDQRTRPAAELLARVPLVAPAHVVDLGSGPGNSTALLRARFPAARLTGVDSAPDMLRAARAALPEVEWVEADVASYAPPQPADLLFANALFQWLPAHERLFARLLEQLTPGGVLAVQMPHNYDEPSHRLMRETPGPWRARLSAVRALSRVESAAFYYDLLAPHCAHLDLWQTRYEHVMDGADAIVEWVKGTGLLPYLEALEPHERPAFLEAYREGIAAAYPARSDGKRLFSFPRLFFVAVTRSS
jgi:trans-aconitate 2-methyltransferase